MNARLLFNFISTVMHIPGVRNSEITILEITRQNKGETRETEVRYYLTLSYNGRKYPSLQRAHPAMEALLETDEGI